MKIWCFDCFSGLRHNDSWGREVSRAAILRGHEAKLFHNPNEITSPGYIFARRRQFPPLFERDEEMFQKLWLDPGANKWIQDRKQWQCYENKISQFLWFGNFMPDTHVICSKEVANEVINASSLPIVSKSSVGSASVNVRILKNRCETEREIELAFGDGIQIKRGAETALQQGYLLIQQFIAHDVTWRVTAIGSKRHVYKRFCYPDRNVAAPSAVRQTEPVEMSEKVESLLEFSDKVFKEIGTKWCAIDVLESQYSGWKLLETSLAWARGNDPAGNANFYNSHRSLNQQADLLIDEIEAGSFG